MCPALAKFGIDKLDDMLGGGLDRDTVNLVVGRNGVGKTILASQWAAEGVREGENVAYILTTMSENSCKSYLGNFSFMKDCYDKIDWIFLDIDVRDLLPLTKENFNRVFSSLFRGKLDDVDRLVFDSVTSVEKAFADPVLYRRALKFFSDLCYDSDVTALIVEEAPLYGEFGEAKALSECVIHLDILRVPNGYARAMRLIKKYRTGHPLDWIPYEITDDGIVLKEGRYVRVSYEFHYESG
ncbi:RecA-superfamily ATPases implicated in signal transduction [Geoglobus ahangari]|uniref:RecA-superfamily ATPases implicated in signal transduction n=2 Tax=Geoglobus ahangari TaxID=113653 RepID=A0A0F7IDG0_9EURY|nr:RecA-superfamily ATPases implicated in signal transduction [Geoglobus ahangari]